MSKTKSDNEDLLRKEYEETLEQRIFENYKLIERNKEMSRSNPVSTNPCQMFIEFKGGTGKFQYYDKAKEENIELEYPIKFMVLDELSTVTGYNDNTQSGVYSNEVHNLNEEVLHIRTFKGNNYVAGKYAEIKAQMLSMGGKFCKSVYCGLIQDGDLKLVNFKLKGVAFAGWLEKKINVFAKNTAVVITGTTDGKKGAVKYKIPVFETEIVDDIYDEKATEMDKELQTYLKSRKHKEVETAEAGTFDTNGSYIEEEQSVKEYNLPF